MSSRQFTTYLFLLFHSLFILTRAQTDCNTKNNPTCAGIPVFEALCCPSPSVCYWSNRYGAAACCPAGQNCAAAAAGTAISSVTRISTVIVASTTTVTSATAATPISSPSSILTTTTTNLVSTSTVASSASMGAVTTTTTVYGQATQTLVVSRAEDRRVLSIPRILGCSVVLWLWCQS